MTCRGQGADDRKMFETLVFLILLFGWIYGRKERHNRAARGSADPWLALLFLDAFILGDEADSFNAEDDTASYYEDDYDGHYEEDL